MKDNNALVNYAHFTNLSIADLARLSERSKEILIGISDEMAGDGQIKSHLELDNQSNLLQISFKYSTNFKQSLVLGVMKKLFIRKNIDEISQFSFREFESFLRDQNDKVSFEGELMEEFIAVFGQMKLFFIGDVYKKSLQNNLELANKQAQLAHDFSLVALNRLAVAVLKHLGLELIYANEQEIVMTGSKLGLSSNELETILLDVFKVFPKLQDLKVVAV